MLQIQGVGKRYGTGDGAVDALTDVSLTVADGEFAALVGPSGCGKTTLLNLIAGLDEHDAGSILVDGASPTAEDRLNHFGYMPQEDLLFPWRTVLENVSLGLEVQGVDKREARQRAADLFPQFGLAGFEHRRPHEVSGGMRQRASFLRTYLLGRPFLLLDEPFGALDAITRGQLQSWLAETWNRIGGSALLVTHDPHEAVALSDRVYVMSPRPGTITNVLEVDLPRPRTARAAETEAAHQLIDYLRHETEVEEVIA
ncbi:MAG: ABC transporter ATP-binding protein [Chloroflexi bacterium]|nr:ABC transporter ATP-binding protein [Chloroflexota bacterium]MCY3588910.1 ABC transporter ATP-binding protein [Chloroflexota bacterium]MCY3686220.1 ABC transporter ATP-binding protein [Chloroflexota bacterium]MDE2708841.1 ABC transporter ATP-binding protein [Chloroflexota bacterium]